MNVALSGSAIDKFQAAIQAAKKRNNPVEAAPAKTSREMKLEKLQSSIKRAKKTIPSPVRGSLYSKAYGMKSQAEVKETTPRLGMQFDAYA